jgi:hypothetical protein
VAGITVDFSIDCGLCGAPKSYNRSGRNVFVIGVAGTVYQKDAAAVRTCATGDEVTPETGYPSATALTEWIPVGAE